MHTDRLSNGERISAGSAVLLFVFMFFRWYGLGTDERPNLLFDLRLFEDGGNAWQTLEVIPVFLALVVAVALGVAVRRLIGEDWEPPVSPGAVVCVLGALAACLVLIRIVFPPDLGGEFEGFTFEATLKAGIFLALAAACGIAYGGRRAMQEEGVSFADLRPLRHRDNGQLRARGSRFLAVLVVLVVATGASDLELANISQAETPKRSVADPDAPLAPAAATGAFGLDLMRAQRSGNLVLSPDSVAAALAMTGMGGVGRTAEEVARTLHLKGPIALPTVGDLQRAIVAGQAAAATGNPEPPTLEIANGLFLRQGLPFAPAFLSGAQRRFGATPETVDFEGDPTGALEAINGWVSEHTKELIPQILDLQSKEVEEMALALANAVYLDADWVHPFETSETRPGVFHKTAGKVTVDLMHQTESLRYGAGPGYRAVVLPYRSSTLSLLVMLPVRQPLGALQHRLDGRSLERIADSLAPRPVVLSLPRFHLNTDVELTGVLKKLGMPTAFSEAANFSRLTKAVPLKIAFVKHAADFTVDEAGTVAAAATVVGMVPVRGPGLPRDAVAFNANRPFLFFLRDDRTGAVLFAGRLTDPASAGV